MATKRYSSILTILLVIVVCANLFNVGLVRADGETPSEPPAPTEVVTEAPTEAPVVEATQEPTEVPAEPSPESTPVPPEATESPVAEVLTQIPESTEVIVLDAEGTAVPLAAEEAAEIISVVDPMWCPEGVLPGGPGCTTNFASISALITNMVSTTANYMQNGIIYFTANPGTGNFSLTPTTLPGGDFEALNDFNLTLQGGWNGDTVTPLFSGQTTFGSSPLTIGTSLNPWAGNITINDIVFAGASQTSLTVHTTTGNITLGNVDVTGQGNGKNTALLTSGSGNITVTDGTFSGNGTNSAGFLATTGTGSITITDSSFSNNKVGTGTVDGATLNATSVTLTNVTAANNDGDGITINNASEVALTNVMATSNGTDPAGPGNNDGSGVLINGTVGSSLFINGGSFSSNKEYGIELGNPANTGMYVLSQPICTGNTLGCTNGTFIVDASVPDITPGIGGTAGLAGWYTSPVTVNWSVSDPESGIASSNGCATSTLLSDTTGTTVTCSATNKVGLSHSVSVTIRIDQTAPVLSLPGHVNAVATSPAGATVGYSASAIDNIQPVATITCSPASGSLFPLGTTTVNCSASDEAGNSASGSFPVTVSSAPVTGTPPVIPPTPATVPPDGSESSNSSGALVPVTGGLIDLDCDTVLSAFQVRLSFINLCEQQASLKGIRAGSLPGRLPDGSTLILGLEVKILSQGQELPQLPGGSGIQLDFPAQARAGEQLAVLYWDGTTWIEISQKARASQIPDLVAGEAVNQLYLIDSRGSDLYTILTAENTGVFVLVQK